MPSNSLIHEKSPYLLQHAHNPVDWRAWGEDAFQKARDEDKPIFLSVGYSTCHWCHVMEHESFENQDIAALLNRYFVPIKVDREERPDVDRVYMLFVQATTGSGGWPMSVWLTPDLRPFFGGTYFPPETRYGHPGFRRILESLAEAWKVDRASIVESSGAVLDQLRMHVQPSAPGVPDAAVLDSGFYAFRRTFDTRHGGFGGAPKFPRPATLEFLLRYHARTGNLEALEMVFATLNKMGRGGIRDHLGGGFHRYATDDHWFVPHFEKMLYDQAQLAVSYLEANQLSSDEFYADAARSTLDYVLRDMTDAGGGFYSAEDADSVADPAQPAVKVEGAYYVWTKAEIDAVLGPDADSFNRAYGVVEAGNAHEFPGQNILSLAEVGQALPPASSARLLEARSRRVRPHLDDKILTAWNGLMISAFAKGALVLSDSRYLDAARRAADFVLTRMYDVAAGTLLRRFREGDAAIPAFLDDYAFFVQGLLDLYQVEFDASRIETARRLTETMISLFEDPESGGFFATAQDEPSLVLRLKDDYDGAEPSGNAIAILNLLRLARLTGRRDFEDTANKALAAFAPRLSQAPEAMPQMLAALEYSRSKPVQIVLAGSRDAIEPFVNELRRRFLPFETVILAAHAPAHYPSEPAAAYVCENFACQLPATDPREFARSLDKSPAAARGAGFSPRGT
jgi:uncharacterized protein YyaL (SSP411 family)